MKPKIILIKLITILIVGIITYLCLSFLNLSFSISEWNGFSRFLSLLIMLPTTIVILD